MVFSASLQAIGLSGHAPPGQLRWIGDESVEVKGEGWGLREEVEGERDEGERGRVQPTRSLHSPLAMFNVLETLSQRHGLFGLWRGFGYYIASSVICVLVQSIPDVLIPTIKDTIGSKTPKEGSVERKKERKRDWLAFLWSAMIQSAKQMIGLPFYAATVIILVGNQSVVPLPLTFLLHRNFRGAENVKTLFSLWGLVVPYALTCAIQDSVWEGITQTTMAAIKEWQTINRNDKRHKRRRIHSHPSDPSSDLSARGGINIGTSNANQSLSTNTDEEPVRGGGESSVKWSDSHHGQSMLLSFLPDLAGSFAGVIVSEALTFPMWVVMSRLILQGTGTPLADIST
eukprot:Ihof_evm1s580 gene=Ihof_evmTU1s580